MPSRDELTTGQKRKLTRLRRDLVGWASENGRDLPWRNARADTYEKIVVEVLLQRTTASAVARSYRGFFEKFPDWDALANANLSELEEFLRPLGLWRRRAAALTGLARFVSKTGGEFPSDPKDHEKIPAVGQYVSNAILLFQHGRAAPLLDVNMARVIERFIRPRRLADIRHDPWLQAAARWYARGDEVVDANWAMLDFAALVCRARKPTCGSCPVRARCNQGVEISQPKLNGLVE